MRLPWRRGRSGPPRPAPPPPRWPIPAAWPLVVYSVYNGYTCAPAQDAEEGVAAPSEWRCTRLEIRSRAMMTSLPFRPVISFGFALLTAGVGARPALAFHKKQQFQVQAATVASAPTYTTTAAAPPTFYYSVPNPTASA